MSPASCAALVLAILLRIGFSDWHGRKIRNRDVAAVLLIGGLHFLLSGAIDFAALTAALAIALALTAPGFLLGLVGGGDVKLMLALAPFWPGLQLLAVFTCGVLLTSVFLAPRLLGARLVDANLSRSLPLGTAMAIGTCCWPLLQLTQWGSHV
jgi:prepilin peptidase CpaA